MYVLYTDGRFEYAPEQSFNVNYSEDYILSNGYIRYYNRKQSTDNTGIIISSGYVCTIDFDCVIIGPCHMSIDIRDSDGNSNYILDQYFTRGIQFYHNSIPVYKNFPNGFSYFIRIDYLDASITAETYPVIQVLTYDYSYLYINYS